LNGSHIHACGRVRVSVELSSGMLYRVRVNADVFDFSRIQQLFRLRTQYMITCYLRYFIAPGKLKEFEEYGRRWTKLIEKYGGTHLGYFVPEMAPDEISSRHFSFPGLGSEGPTNVGIALYSFPNLDAYIAYRRMAAEDEECKAVSAQFNLTKCFVRYERSF